MLGQALPDVAIVGGGVIGAATAFWLTRLAPEVSVTVYERDPSYARSATALSVASIRAQFSTPVNIEISRFGLAFLRDIREWLGPAGEIESIGLRENGYLFLARSEDGADTLRRNCALQRSLGAATALLTPAEIAARFGWMNTDDLALGSLGLSGEGWFDNMGLLWGLRRAAAANGAQFRNARVVALDAGGSRIRGVSLDTGERVTAGLVVLAAGAESAVLLSGLGEEIPVEHRKRTVFLVDSPDLRCPSAPLIVDPAGYYMRPEGEMWIVGGIPAEDSACAADDFEPDWEMFEESLWPKLFARAEGFARLKPLRAWAGHYDYNRWDQNAFLGPLPGWENLFLGVGFSGHGLQQAPAVGRGLAEQVLHGAYLSLDLSPLAAARLRAGVRVLETEVV